MTTRQQAHRARQRADEVASSRVWLLAIAAKNPPGARVAAPALHAAAVAAIRPRHGKADGRLGDGLVWRTPGLRVFYATADEVLGKRWKSDSSYYFTIPVDEFEQDDNLVVTPRAAAGDDELDGIRERAAAIQAEADALTARNDQAERELDLYERRLALFSAGDKRGALLIQREMLAAQRGTPLPTT